jgi:hypothetical protein
MHLRMKAAGRTSSVPSRILLWIQRNRLLLAAMFETRKDIEDWKTGAELEAAALSYLHEHRDALFEAAGID